jgi:hypothetical protein
MFSEVTVDVDGQEITLNLCATTQGTFVSFRNCYTQRYVGYDFDEMIEAYIEHLRNIAESLRHH